MIDLEHIALTLVQSRILLTLFAEGGLGTAALLEAVGMSGKTWSKEMQTLQSLGLLTSIHRKDFTSEGIKLVRHHNLTDKGMRVAERLTEVSNVIINVLPS